jgi:hypothetical protein
MCADLRSVTINPFRNRLPGFFGAAALGLLIFAHYGIDDLTLQDWATPQNGRTTPATASAGSAVPTATLTATTLATTSRYVSGNPIAPALPDAFTAPGQRPNPTPPGAASFGGTSTVPPLIVRSPAASGLAAPDQQGPGASRQSPADAPALFKTDFKHVGGGHAARPETREIDPR